MLALRINIFDIIRLFKIKCFSNVKGRTYLMEWREGKLFAVIFGSLRSECCTWLDLWRFNI